MPDNEQPHSLQYRYPKAPTPSTSTTTTPNPRLILRSFSLFPAAHKFLFLSVSQSCYDLYHLLPPLPVFPEATKSLVSSRSGAFQHRTKIKTRNFCQAKQNPDTETVEGWFALLPSDPPELCQFLKCGLVEESRTSSPVTPLTISRVFTGVQLSQALFLFWLPSIEKSQIHGWEPFAFAMLETPACF